MCWVSAVARNDATAEEVSFFLFFFFLRKKRAGKEPVAHILWPLPRLHLELYSAPSQRICWFALWPQGFWRLHPRFPLHICPHSSSLHGHNGECQHSNIPGDTCKATPSLSHMHTPNFLKCINQSLDGTLCYTHLLAPLHFARGLPLWPGIPHTFLQTDLCNKHKQNKIIFDKKLQFIHSFKTVYEWKNEWMECTNMLWLLALETWLVNNPLKMTLH